jgi:hypothetical protein
MRRITTLFALSLMLFGSLLIAIAPTTAAQGNGDGYIPYTETIVIDTTVPGWQNTGIIIEKGATISVSGQASCDVVGDIWHECVSYLGPEGLAGTVAAGSDFPLWLAPGLPKYSLVGTIDGGTPFVVGGSTTVVGDGELHLGYNDQQTKFGDNDGQFVVTVSSCRPGNGIGDTNHCHFGAPGQG